MGACPMQTGYRRPGRVVAGFVVKIAGGPCIEMRLEMRKNDTDFATKDVTDVERPRLYKVILINDDFTPREFVVFILKAEFRMNEAQAQQVMLTANRARRLRGRGLHPGCRRDQGDAGDRCGAQKGVSAAVHHRAGGVKGWLRELLRLPAPNRAGWHQVVRMVLAALLAYLGTALVGLHHGYWAVITCLIIVQGSLGATIGAGIMRLAGTAAGVVLGGFGVFAAAAGSAGMGGFC